MPTQSRSVLECTLAYVTGKWALVRMIRHVVGQACGGLKHLGAGSTPVLGATRQRVQGALVRLDVRLEREALAAARVRAGVRQAGRVGEQVLVQEVGQREGGHAVRALVGLQVVRLQPVQQQLVARGEQVAAVGARQHRVQELVVGDVV